MSDITRVIRDSGAIKHGTFELSDGRLSDCYIDTDVFETRPEILDGIASEVVARLDPAEIDVIAGPEPGAVPLVVAVSLESGVPAAFVRRERAHSGTQTRVGGSIQNGDRVALIEDVTTTGKTVVDTATVVEDIGGTPERLLTVVDRNQGAVENVREAGYELECLVRVDENTSIERAQ